MGIILKFMDELFLRKKWIHTKLWIITISWSQNKELIHGLKKYAIVGSIVLKKKKKTSNEMVKN
jgi:hypothetical protein